MSPPFYLSTAISREHAGHWGFSIYQRMGAIEFFQQRRGKITSGNPLMLIGRRSLVLGTIFVLCGGAETEAACVNAGMFCSDQYVFSKKLLHDLSCKELWTLRNSIYNEHGYCFTRRLEAEKFDNTDCTVDVFSKLALNEYERDNAAEILEVERAKLCHEPLF